MKKTRSTALLSLALLVGLAFALGACATAGGPGAPAGEAGQKAPAGEPGQKAPEGYRYVCNCGPDCNCGSNAAKPGNCTCGKPMALKKVLSQDADYYYVCPCKDCKCDSLWTGSERRCSCGKGLKNYPKKGAYTCACKGCDCDMQANVPGKCTCGGDMKPRQ